MIDQKTSEKRLVACVTYLERISIDMPTKPSFFGRPDDLLEQHHSEQIWSKNINTLGRFR